MIPSNISFNESGALNKRSSDFSRDSIGNITGLTAVEVKNEVIAIIPMNIWLIVMLLPRIQDIIIKKGNNNPNINTGPLLI
jgi:hypothetical protein